jgi:uncharacterized protein (DUF4415 family)
MKKVVAEKYRNIDFSRAKRCAVVKPKPGKTKISIRLDNAVLECFRSLVGREKKSPRPHREVVYRRKSEF